MNIFFNLTLYTHFSLFNNWKNILKEDVIEYEKEAIWNNNFLKCFIEEKATNPMAIFFYSIIFISSAEKKFNFNFVRFA